MSQLAWISNTATYIRNFTFCFFSLVQALKSPFIGLLRLTDKWPSFAKARNKLYGRDGFLRRHIVSHPILQPNRRRVKLYRPLRDRTDHSRRQRSWEIAKRNRRESGLGSAAHWRDYSHGRNRTSYCGSSCGSSTSSKWVLCSWPLSSQLHTRESPILGDGYSPTLMWNFGVSALRDAGARPLRSEKSNKFKKSDPDLQKATE